jgi:hypothetical protein
MDGEIHHSLTPGRSRTKTELLRIVFILKRNNDNCGPHLPPENHAVAHRTGQLTGKVLTWFQDLKPLVLPGYGIYGTSAKVSSSCNPGEN